MAAEKVRPQSSRLFSHPADVHCAIYNVVVLACYGLAFWLWLNPEISHLDSVADKIAFCLGAGFLLGWISGVNVGVVFHNHAHRPIFKNETLGRWFGHIWTFTGGWPAFYWYHNHVVVHHANLLDEELDWTMPKRRPDGRFESVYRYIFLAWPWRYVPHIWRDFKSSRGGAWVRRRAIKDGLIFLALWSIPWFIDPWMAIGLWVFPQWIGNAVIMGSGMYVQHAQLPEKQSTAHYHSNTFLSPFFNLTMFNIGYHVEHHEYGQVHWSALPRFHLKMKDRYLREGWHVVPYGYYHAAHIVSRPFQTEKAFVEFTRDQAQGYESPEDPRKGVLVPQAAPGKAQPADTETHAGVPS